MTERQGGEGAKKRRRPHGKDDDEFQIEPAPARRKTNVRKPKEKKPGDPANSNGSADPLATPLPLHPIPMYNQYIEEDDMRECNEMVTKLMSLPPAIPFLEPVDYESLELSYYPTVVKNPMDLGTVKQMLQHGTLENPGHFAEHVRLVFKNAMDFNQPGSGIYNDAENLLTNFEMEFKKLCDKWDSEPASELKQEDKKEIDSEEKDKMEIETMQQNLNLIKTTIAGMKKQIEILKKSKKKTNKNQTHSSF